MYDDNRTTMILYYKVVATTYGASEHFNRWRCNADDDVTPAFTWYRVSHQPCRVLKHVDAYSRITTNVRIIIPDTWAPTGFFPGVGKLGVWRRKSPSGVQEW